MWTLNPGAVGRWCSFSICYFYPDLGKWSFDEYFSDGLKPPTSDAPFPLNDCLVLNVNFQGCMSMAKMLPDSFFDCLVQYALSCSFCRDMWHVACNHSMSLQASKEILKHLCLRILEVCWIDKLICHQDFTNYSRLCGSSFVHMFLNCLTWTLGRWLGNHHDVGLKM